MRPESVKTVRIRSSVTRNDSGSVSPPAPTVSSNGKLVFVERMRKMYGKPGQDPAELEIKIEQLWNGLTPSQRGQFIKKDGEKENISQKTPMPPVRPVIPVLERRNNCKAIAKVLDLKSTKPTVSYAELVKNRMKAYSKEGTMILSRILPPSPPSHIPFPPSTTSSAEMPTKSVENSLKPVKIEEKPVQKLMEIPKISQNLASKPTIGSIGMKSITRKVIIKDSRKSLDRSTKKLPVKMISYDEASKTYYQTLSQAFLIHSVDTTMLSTYANIMEGCRPIREYKFGKHL